MYLNTLLIRMARAVSVSALSAVLLPLPASAQPTTVYGGPRYSAATGDGFRDPGLPRAPGFTAGNGVGVGNANKYLGHSDRGMRAVRWDASGTAATELGNLGGTYCDAMAINDAGTTVGSAAISDPLGVRAVRWDEGGTAATELGNLDTDTSGSTICGAFAINAAGTIAGYASKYVGGTFAGTPAVRWDAGGTVATELGNLGGECRAYAINDAGTIAGDALTASSPLN